MERIRGSSKLARFKAFVETKAEIVSDLVILGPEGKSIDSTVLDEYLYLERLELANVGVPADIWGSICQLRNLRGLCVSYSAINPIGIGALSSLKKLRSLNLTCTLTDDDALAEISAISTLHELVLVSTNVQTLSPLHSLNHLRKLYLTQTNVSDEEIRKLLDCAQIEFLHLEGTSITDAGLIGLDALTNLHTLAIHNTCITSAAYEVVSRLPSLRELYIDQELDDDSIDHLRALPNLKRIYCGDTLPKGQKELLEREVGLEVF